MRLYEITGRYVGSQHSLPSPAQGFPPIYPSVDVAFQIAAPNIQIGWSSICGLYSVRPERFRLVSGQILDNSMEGNG